MPRASYLLVIGDREALAWVLSAQRTAFPSDRRMEVRALRPADRLFIYTTRACFKNPNRDRGRVIGTASVASPVTPLDDPPSFFNRVFPVGCALRLATLAPYQEGVELAPLTPHLDAFDGSGHLWSMRLRRPLVPLTKTDAAKLDERLDRLQRTPAEVLGPYLRWLPVWAGSEGA